MRGDFAFLDSFPRGPSSHEAQGIKADDGIGQGFLEGVVFRLKELEFKIRDGTAALLEQFESFEFWDELGFQVGERLDFHFFGAGAGALGQVCEHAWEQTAQGRLVGADPFAASIPDVFVDQLHWIFGRDVFQFVIDDQSYTCWAEEAGGIQFLRGICQLDAKEGFQEDGLAAEVLPDGITSIAFGFLNEEVDVFHDEGTVPGQEPQVIAGERFLPLEGDLLPLADDGGEGVSFAIFFAGADVIGSFADIFGMRKSSERSESSRRTLSSRR